MPTTQTSPSTEGKVRPITRWTTPILHRPVCALPSTAFNTSELDTLVADMFATMYAADGAGLAANQVGVDQSVFVYDVTDRGKRTWGVVCNPVVEVHDHDQTNNLLQAGQGKDTDGAAPSLIEGCLSYPGILASVHRPRHITLRGLDERGGNVELHATGLLAKILQHEVDHLNGVVYGDHVDGETRRRMDEKYKELQGKEAFPEGWPVGEGRREGRWTVVNAGEDSRTANGRVGAGEINQHRRGLT